MTPANESLCVLCGEPILGSDDGGPCEGCHYPVHRRCQRPSAAAARQTCAACSVDLAAAASGLTAGPAGAARGFPVRTLLGILFLVLAACCLLPTPAIVAEADNVSGIIGTFLPTLICLIIGLLLLRRSRPKA
jgi:hypothetical protein